MKHDSALRCAATPNMIGKSSFQLFLRRFLAIGPVAFQCAAFQFQLLPELLPRFSDSLKLKLKPCMDGVEPADQHPFHT